MADTQNKLCLFHGSSDSHPVMPATSKGGSKASQEPTSTSRVFTFHKSHTILGPKSYSLPYIPLCLHILEWHKNVEIYLCVE